MDLNLPVSLLWLLFAFVLFLLGIIFWVLIRLTNVIEKRRDTVTEMNALTRYRSDSIIHMAVQKAQELIANAELAGTKIFAREKLSGKQIADEYKKHLDKLKADFEEQFVSSAKSADQHMDQFFQHIQEILKDNLEKNERLAQEKSQLMLSQSQQLLARFTEDMEVKVKSQVDEEFIKARQEIIHYKQHRLAVVDEQILELLEDVLRAILKKKLTLADQSDLVYEALEEAKKNQLFDKS